jgi:predicted O-methyltransferase YrrM
MSYIFSQNWFLGSELRKSNVLDSSKENRILEIGCFEGQSSVYFADNFINQPKSSLVCVDPFMLLATNDHRNLLSNNEEGNFDYNISICKNTSKVTVLKVTSDAFFQTNKDTFTFIYIDGCHEPDYIQRDLENAWKVLEQNGIMWMDDYGGGSDGLIKKTMDAFLEKYTGSFQLIHKGYQLAIKKI